MTYAQLREDNFRRQWILVPDEYVLIALKQMKLELWSAHADESTIDDGAEDGEYFYTTVDAEYVSDMSDEEVAALGPFGVSSREEARNITAYCTAKAAAEAIQEKDVMTKVPPTAYAEAFALLDEAVELINREMNEQRTKLLKRRHAAAVRAELQYGKDSVEFKKATDAVNNAGHGEYPTPQWLSDAGLAVGAVAYELGKAAHKSILDYEDVLGAIMQLKRYVLPFVRLSRVHEIAQELDRWHTEHVWEKADSIIENFALRYVWHLIVENGAGTQQDIWVATCSFDEHDSVHVTIDESWKHEGLFAWEVDVEQLKPGDLIVEDYHYRFVRFA